MPRYYFHVRDGGGLVEDEEGRELADADVARNEALKGVRSIVSEEAKQGLVDLRGTLEVHDGARLVLSLPFSDAIELRPGDPSA
jgi:hypothetical protein